MIATPLFSCRVSASLFSELMSTYSGSASSGAASPFSAEAGSATSVIDHSVGPPSRPTTLTEPAGAWGRSPSSPPAGVTASLRWFSIAIAA